MHVLIAEGVRDLSGGVVDRFAAAEHLYRVHCALRIKPSNNESRFLDECVGWRDESEVIALGRRELPRRYAKNTIIDTTTKKRLRSKHLSQLRVTVSDDSFGRS